MGPTDVEPIQLNVSGAGDAGVKPVQVSVPAAGGAGDVQVQVSVSGTGNVTAGRDIHYRGGDVYTVASAEKALSKADKTDIAEAVIDGVRKGYIAPAVATQLAGGAPARRRGSWGVFVWPSIAVAFMLVAALSQVDVDWLRTKNYLITGGLAWLAWLSVKRGWW